MAEVLRGIAFPSTPAVPSIELFSVSDRAQLAIAAYDSLGMVTDKGQALEDYQGKLQTLHGTLVKDHAESDPGVEPFIGLELPSDLAFKSLVAAFDKNQSLKTVTYDTLWDQYRAHELNARLARKKPTKPDTTPNGTDEAQGQALAMLLGGDRTDEPGLYFTGKNLKKQLKAFEDEKDSYDYTHPGSELLVANPADYVIMDAQRREAGEPLLDTSTFNRFIQLAMKSVDGSSCLPRAYSFSGQLRLGGSRGHAFGDVGGRLLVGQKPETLAS